VRLTATEGLGIHLVAPAMADLHRAHPGLQVELLLDSRSLSLSRREADLALRLARPRQPGLVARKLGEVRSALYASARYLKKPGRPAVQDGLWDIPSWPSMRVWAPCPSPAGCAAGPPRRLCPAHEQRAGAAQGG
jgi:DNA-binding transcriptional LysR family regulator